MAHAIIGLAIYQARAFQIWRRLLINIPTVLLPLG
jgi:hypothetical protein